ncbi:MAG: hypothetical protein J5I50_09475 [Chitinophagaceae bacterium]|nr:hypothetical protein [Chitinophagaceae bacterium]
MDTATIRKKLHDYIRTADDKKVKAIYTMLEDTIEAETNWWEDKRIVSELEERYRAWNTGEEKGYLMSDIDKEVIRLKKKRASK